jgi:hypothetical protein
LHELVIAALVCENMIAVILTSLTIVAVLLGPILVKQIERNVIPQGRSLLP